MVQSMKNAGACKRWKIVSLFGFQGAERAPFRREERAESEKWNDTKLSLHTFFLERKYAPLAQLVEQLTLNQWVPGSNP